MAIGGYAHREFLPNARLWEGAHTGGYHKLERSLQANCTAVATPTTGVFKLAPEVLPQSNGIEAFRSCAAASDNPEDTG